jgi:hypothetical protein
MLLERHASRRTKARVGSRARVLAIETGLSFARWRDALPRPAMAHFGACYALNRLQNRCLRICIDGAVSTNQARLPSVVHAVIDTVAFMQQSGANKF